MTDRIAKVSVLAQPAAGAPGDAAAAAAARATAAGPAGPAPQAAAAAAAAASAAALRVLHARLARIGDFTIEDEECPQADVGDFFFAEIDFRGPCGIPYIGRGPDSSRGGCGTARQRYRHADGSGNRNGPLQLLLLGS